MTFSIIILIETSNVDWQFYIICKNIRKYKTISYCIKGNIRPILFSLFFSCKRFRPALISLYREIIWNIAIHPTLNSATDNEGERNKNKSGKNISLYTVVKLNSSQCHEGAKGGCLSPVSVVLSVWESLTPPRWDTSPSKVNSQRYPLSAGWTETM